MASQLVTSPTEVVEIIANLLDRHSLCSARLTCKELNQKTFHYFARTYLSVLHTDLSPKSLQRLHLISRAELLTSHAHTLVIEVRPKRFGPDYSWRPLRPSPTVQTLRAILTDLVNCRSLQIQISGGGVEDEYASEYLLPSDAIGIILDTSAEDGLRIKSLHIRFRGWQLVDAELLKRQLHQQPNFLTAWGNIGELRLDHYLTGRTIDTSIVIIGYAQHIVIHNNNLKTLSLGFRCHFASSFIESLLSSVVVFQNLREIELGRINVSADMLWSLLLSCRVSLRMLYLQHTNMVSGTWAATLTRLKTLPSLDNIVIHRVKEFVGGKSRVLKFSTLDTQSAVPGSGGQKIVLDFYTVHGLCEAWGASFKSKEGMNDALQILSKSVTYHEVDRGLL